MNVVVACEMLGFVNTNHNARCPVIEGLLKYDIWQNVVHGTFAKKHLNMGRIMLARVYNLDTLMRPNND